MKIVSDACRVRQFQIDGLSFEPNHVLSARGPEGLTTKIVSNPGELVGHFVTHGRDFRYHEFGVHVGQDDRLTFVAAIPRRIVGTFVDCRAGSPTCGLRETLSFSTSAARKLIVPRGVAHTFDGLEGVVTRNDVKLFADPSNPDWRIENDDLTVARDASPAAFPRVRVNAFALPLAASVLFYRLQRRALAGGAGLPGFAGEVSVAGQRRRIFIGREQADPEPRRPTVPREGWPEGVHLASNSYNAVARGSWSIVPSTDACVMDLVQRTFTAATPALTLHTRHDVLHTFLDREGVEVGVELLDLRRGSPTFQRRVEGSFACDPRRHLQIPAGVAHRYSGPELRYSGPELRYSGPELRYSGPELRYSGPELRYSGPAYPPSPAVNRPDPFLLRVEYRLRLDAHEPRLDLPPIGADCLSVQEDDALAREGLDVPQLIAPDEVLWLVARTELEGLNDARGPRGGHAA